MLSEQLAHKFWLALDNLRGNSVSATTENATLTAQLRTHDAFSCVVERLTVQWSASVEWETILEKCEKGLQGLHRDFSLVERDDRHRQALFRSPLAREVYWEAILSRSLNLTLTVCRFRCQPDGGRTVEPFVLTEEQLSAFLQPLLD